MKDCVDIFSTLEGFQRLVLEDIRRFFGAEIPSHLRKRDFVRRLGSFIIDSPEVWLRRMLERDLRLLRHLVQAGPEVPVCLEYPDYPSVLETVKLIGSDISEDSRFLWIPKPLYDVVSPFIADVIAECESDGTFEMERAALGYLQFYGVMSLEEFYDCMLEYWKFSGREDIDLFARTLYDSPIFKIAYVDVEGERYCVSPNVFNPVEVLDGRNENPSIGMKHFSPVEAVRAGSGSPLFVFGLDTPQGIELVRTLTSLGYSGDDLVKVEHDIWINSQMIHSDDSTEMIFTAISSRQDDIPSFEAYDRCMQVVADYANSLPKWVLGGHSSLETNRMKVLIQSEEDPFDAMVRDNPLLGLFVYPVPPDEECPCGSGISYRNCHGKFKS
ncbi:MAG: SEC-C domain-containing protein [Candidatus Cryptobacteroides sp.]|uniref:SEC-C domain-containing protein n=1 Tax=Candidatus Cryptobacteroides sp. TaxID=2952915 RepID=UPI002A83F67A|nr:SEC-C domain-containing protein [Candidatus Cryptobacteroides sp.]MDY5043055.1 SEC-C domain-containing protein [Candidatus Cryptobacteroides sp.]